MKPKYICKKCQTNKVFEFGIVCTPCFDKYWERPLAVEQELDDDDPEEEDE